LADPFVHLHVHSDYTLLDGAARIERLAARAAALGMPALALTDGGNLFGAVQFYRACTRVKVKPILGMEAYVTRGSRFDKTVKSARGLDHLVLLAQNEIGLQNLMRLSTAGYLEGFYYRPRVDYELVEEHAEGLIALSSGMSGAISRELLAGRPRQALEVAGRHKEIFGDRFYVELQDHGIPHQQALLPQLTDVARKVGLPLVATNDVHYMAAAEAEAQEILLLIQQQRTVADPGRLSPGTDQRHFRSGEEMRSVFAALPEALAATLEIAGRIDLKLNFDDLRLPKFPLPEGFDNPNDYLQHLARRGLDERYGAATESLRERLEFELGIILQMGYAGYFLIVRDFIHHARKEGIAVGPGRGSAAGSLVAYCLGITDIDPIRFGLLFERFLNPERVSMPDIDVDFDYRRRGEVIDYVKSKYGEESVTQIITFGTMAARGVIRDVGRALGIAFEEIDRIAKLVPGELGITLDRALEQIPELSEMARSDENHARLIRVARILEGLARHASTHAAGVLIAPGRLDEMVPLFRSGKGEVSTQWDMKSVEKVGLLKMDFLGLRTLTVIEDALDHIRERTGARPELRALPLDDPATYDLLRRAGTVAVFQLESSGMRDLLRRLAPESFDDIVAVNALYRPGPMGSGMVQNFIDRKHGREPIVCMHEILEPILMPTYGMMVYQEQVMQIASVMAGFTLGEADLLRRAMGKKDKEEMAAQEKKFVEGAVARGIPHETARRVFEQMAYFAGYGFNKSHSAAYALISYQTAWLKAHHPAEFMAATLTSEMETTDRVMVLVEECRRLGINVFPPDVNVSRAGFLVTDEGIRFGLGAVKNVGVNTIEALVAERERGGPFRSIYDLARRIGHDAINRRVLESLVAAGTLDALLPSRGRLFAAVAGALETGARFQRDQAMGQTSLFGGGGAGGEDDPELPQVPEWDRNTRLRCEKEVLGFYLSEHPLDAYRDEISAVASGDTERLKTLPNGADVGLLGVVTAVKRRVDKKGRPFGFAQVEDYAGVVECVFFSDVFEKAKGFLEPDRVVLVRGRLDRREPEGEPKIVASEAFDFEACRGQLAHTLYVRVPLSGLEEERLAAIGRILERYPGRGDVVFHLETDTGRRVRIRSGRYKVGVHPDLLVELRAELGGDAVRLGETVNGRNGR
jgi:DNA polymerase-3 subunit alpha